MPRYVVELPSGVYDAAQAGSIEWVLRLAARRVAASRSITYQRAEFLPDERRILAWFEAVDEEAVRRVAEIAQVHGVAVSEVISLEGMGDGEAVGGGTG